MPMPTQNSKSQVNGSTCFPETCLFYETFTVRKEAETYQTNCQYLIK